VRHADGFSALSQDPSYLHAGCSGAKELRANTQRPPLPDLKNQNDNGVGTFRYKMVSRTRIGCAVAWREAEPGTKTRARRGRAIQAPRRLADTRQTVEEDLDASLTRSKDGMLTEAGRLLVTPR
jgi:hypothetical protein